jgi:acyl-coenzyme A thioesterase PaaI-like protein
MESTAIFKLLWQGETTTVPKTINITVEYLRSARAEDVFARAVFTRHGRRVANVRVFAFQDDPERPVAVATAHFLLVQD